MVIIARIKLTSPILGELKKDHNGVRQMKKSAGRILVNPEAWQAKFRQAAGILGLRTNLHAILSEPGYECPTLRHYRRRYNQVQMDIFESISKGTVLTLKFALNETLTHAPTIRQFQDLLEAVGLYVGLTQWGEQYGYGRFEVLSAEPVTPVDTCTTHSHDLKSSGAADPSPS